MKKLSAVCLAVAMTLMNCRCDSGSPEPRPAKSPRDLVIRVGEAMYEMNKPEFLACFSGNDAEMKAIGSVADLGAAALRFRGAFIEAYGEQQWESFQDPKKGPKQANATLDLLTKAELEEMKRANIRIEGDRAFCSGPKESSEVVMVKHADGWLIEASSFLPPGAEPEALSDVMTRLAAAVSKVQEVIGREGITVEDIDAELARAMADVMFGMTTPAKHRNGSGGKAKGRAVSNEDFIAMSDAINNDDAGIVKAILARGVDLHSHRMYGNDTFLSLALRFGNRTKGVVDVLLSPGAPVNIQDDYGHAPLHWAAMYCDVETVEKLLALGAKVNVTDKEGYTPLHAACIHNTLPVVQVLIDAGADSDAKTGNGRTAADLARENDKTDIVRMLNRLGEKD